MTGNKGGLGRARELSFWRGLLSQFYCGRPHSPPLALLKGCSPEGKVIITDMDLIEKSNLSRQFLFRPQHIGSHGQTVVAGTSLPTPLAVLMPPHKFK